MIVSSPIVVYGPQAEKAWVFTVFLRKFQMIRVILPDSEGG